MKNNRPVQSNISYHMILPPSSSATRGTASVSAHLETAESSGAHELQPLAHSGHPASIGAAVLRLSPEDVAHLQTNGTVPLNAQSVDAMAQNVPALDTMASAAVVDMDAVVAQLPTHDQQVARDTQQTLRELMVAHDPHERNATLERLATPETRCLLAEFTAHLNRVDEARNREGHFGDRDESEMQAESVSVLSRYLLRNEGTGTLPRLAGNALATGVRAGIGTFVGTLARNFGAFSLQKMINAARATNDGTMPAATRSMVNWMGAGMLALPVVLHIAGGIRDAINGTATRESTTDRFAHSIFALGATALAAATDSYDAVVAWHLAVLIYSAGRAVGAVATRYDSNATSSGHALLASTGVYSVAQGLAGGLQDGMGWNSGAAVEPIRTTRVNPASAQGDSTASGASGLGATTASASAGTTSAIPARIPRTAEEILGAGHNWPANAAHSSLNAVLEIGDDLQNMGLSRLMETTAQNAKWRRMDPDTRAQATAAGLHAAVGVLRITPRASLDSLGEAFATGVRQHQETTIEGLRVSFSREPPSQQTVQARLERAVADLRHLGYRWTADAAPGSAEAGTNRMISAYIAQALTQLAHQQDLDQPFGNSWAELGGRVADQALNVEAHRQHAFQTVFSGLYAAGSAMSDLNLSGASATAAGNAVLAGILAMIYPLLYGGLLSRGAGHAQEEAAAAQADRRAEALRSLQQP